MSLTVWERIRDHLEGMRDRTGQLTDRDVWPIEATEDGIAEAVQVSRSHAAIEIRRLEMENKLRRFLVHVDGGKRRRVCFRWEQTDRVQFTGNRGAFTTGTFERLNAISISCPHCSTRIHAILGSDPRTPARENPHPVRHEEDGGKCPHCGLTFHGLRGVEVHIARIHKVPEA
jgi:hypothetical protein